MDEESRKRVMIVGASAEVIGKRLLSICTEQSSPARCETSFIL